MDTELAPTTIALLNPAPFAVTIRWVAVAGHVLDELRSIAVRSVPVGGENDRVPITAAFAGVAARVATAVATKATTPADTARVSLAFNTSVPALCSRYRNEK